MKKLRFIALAVALCFLIIVPAYAQRERDASDRETNKALLNLMDHFYKKKQELEDKLQGQEKLKDAAEAGTTAKDPRIAEENRRAVTILREAIDITKRALNIVEVQIKEIDRAIAEADIDRKEVLKEQIEFEHMNAAWLRRQHELIREAVEKDKRWTNEVLASLQSIHVPEPAYRPKTLNDLKPGDILLVHPEEGPDGEGSRWIRAADNFIREEKTPASHALTFIGRSAGGRMLFLDHTSSRGSHIIGETEFYDTYMHRRMDVAVAKPVYKVDGRKLLEAALEAHEKEKRHKGPGSTFGLFGKDLVCSEAAAIAVGKATGEEFRPGGWRGRIKAISPVDITPGDFYDDEHLGKYFIISPFFKGLSQ